MTLSLTTPSRIVIYTTIHVLVAAKHQAQDTQKVSRAVCVRVGTAQSALASLQLPESLLLTLDQSIDFECLTTPVAAQLGYKCHVHQVNTWVSEQH